MLPFIILFGLLIKVSSLNNSATRISSPVIQYRQASRDDINYARRSMLENVMNPLSLSEKNLLCAFDEASGNLVGFGQIRPLSHVDGSDCKHFELASVFVKPEYRSKGIGSDLVRELLLRFDETDEALGSSIYLLTLQPTKQFYEQFGFKVVEDNEKEINSFACSDYG